MTPHQSRDVMYQAQRVLRMMLLDPAASDRLCNVEKAMAAALLFFALESCHAVGVALSLC
jgi:hypothetical protein